MASPAPSSTLSPARPRRLPRPALAAVGLLAVLNLLWAAAGGLARVGVLPVGAPGSPAGVATLAAHGALMIGGFFGAVIALERVVALQRGLWIPALAGAGGLLAGTLGALPGAGAWVWPLTQGLWLLSAAGLLGLYGYAWRHRAGSLPLAVEASGALALLLGHAGWAFQSPVTALLGWAAFLVLTIAGERRELMRLRPLPAWARAGFIAMWVGCGVALALTLAWPGAAQTLWWGLMAVLTAWLLVFDVARLQWRAAGWAGHTARCLLVGYGWLGVAAGLGLAGQTSAWHALWLGFVWAMVFGHAPIMLPALAGWRPRPTRWALLPLGVMGLSLAARILADALAWPALKGLAGAGHALAWGLFAAIMVRAVRQGRTPR